MATKAISARIKLGILAQLKMERANGIRTNALINDALCMYLEWLDCYREGKSFPDDQAATYDMFLARWHRHVYTKYYLPKLQNSPDKNQKYYIL